MANLLGYNFRFIAVSSEEFDESIIGKGKGKRREKKAEK
jgi:hypothetical protein